MLSASNGHQHERRACQQPEPKHFHQGDKKGQAEYFGLVALGRQPLADPFIPVKLIDGKEGDVKWYTADDHCIELLIQQKNVGYCTYNKPYVEALLAVRKEEGLLKAKRT
jgi:hypothetical protein